MAKHTPGPWSAEPADYFGDHNIVLADNEDCRAIAAVVSNMRDPFEVEANAHLIAAAPDLLAAAENLLGSAYAQHTKLISPFKELVAAIAKARGSHEG